MQIRLWFVAVLALGAPAPLLGDSDCPAPAANVVLQAGGESIAGFLLRHCTALELTKEQVARLEDIERRLEEQNRPLKQHLMEEDQAPSAPGGPVDSESRRKRAEQHHAQMQQNAQHASEEAWSILTPEQQERARALMR